MNLETTRRYWLSSHRIPLMYVILTLVGGMAFMRLEHRFFPDMVSTISAAAAMAACSSIASGMITLTGIVFSLTFLMVQFSATAYSPRLVLWVARDPIVSHALGVFISTFLYALLLLVWVDRDASGRVPFISAYLTLVWLLASMGMFVALVNRVRMLQITRMLIFTGDYGRQSIERLYRSVEADTAAGEPASLETLKLTQALTHVGRPQVVQAIDIAQLKQLAGRHDAAIEVTSAVGDTVMERSPLLRVYSARQPLDQRLLQNCFEIGDERTFQQDPKYAIRLIVDIAIKALSPAINDPTTAVQALDQVEDLLIRLGHCRLEIGDYRDHQGVLRLTVPFPSWDDFLLLALDEIRHYGGSSVQVMRRMNALVKNLDAVLPPERKKALKGWQARMEATIARSFEGQEEQKEASVADRQGLGIGDE